MNENVYYSITYNYENELFRGVTCMLLKDIFETLLAYRVPHDLAQLRCDLQGHKPTITMVLALYVQCSLRDF